MSVLGRNIRRVDGPAKVTGSVEYTADVVFPRVIFARAKRSLHPHAKLLRIDASRAVRLPGVVAVLPRDDIPKAEAFFGPVVKDQLIVAQDRVRYVGEVVAAVAAEGRDVAEEALDLIDVEYEPLPGVFDPLEAMKPGAPILHEERAPTPVPRMAD